MVVVTDPKKDILYKNKISFFLPVRLFKNTFIFYLQVFA